MRVSGSSGISNVPLFKTVLDKSATSERVSFDAKAALQELSRNSNYFQQIDVVNELLKPEYQFHIDDHIDQDRQLRLLDIAFSQENEGLICYLLNRGARLDLCTSSSRSCSLYLSIRYRLSVFGMRYKDRIDGAIQRYDLQLSESIDSFLVTSRTAEWDTGQASAPTIAKLMSAYAEILALLPKERQIERVIREHQIWKEHFPPIDRSFVIALGRGVIDAFQSQGVRELNCEYVHRTKLRSAYETMIQVIAPSLKKTYREELREWVMSYLRI